MQSDKFHQTDYLKNLAFGSFTLNAVIFVLKASQLLAQKSGSGQLSL